MVGINEIIVLVTLYAASVVHGQAVTTCSAADAACAATSMPAAGSYSPGVGGYRYSYYGYFYTRSTTYCPITGTNKYADCNAACHGDVEFLKCVACCDACCPPPPAVCGSTDYSCRAKSVAANAGYESHFTHGTSTQSRGLIYHDYFTTEKTTHCPVIGTRKYADCAAACRGDVEYNKCVACCGSCCPPPTVCDSADRSCSATSKAAKGGYESSDSHRGSQSNGYTYFTYFTTEKATYCPVTGNRKYADCAAACHGDEKFDECTNCCNSCCPNNGKPKRLFDLLVNELREMAMEEENERDNRYDEY